MKRRAAAALALLASASLLAGQRMYPGQQPNSRSSLGRGGTYGQGGTYDRFGTNPWQVPGQGTGRTDPWGRPYPAVPGIGGGLPTVPTVPLRTPGTDPALLPFFGGRLPTGAQAGGRSRDLSRWPSWLEVGGPGHRALAIDRKSAPKPSHCFLIRLWETVEVRPAGEEAFYPLAFWDASRVLEPGSRVRVFGQGRALLVFSDASRLDVFGDTELTFVRGTKSRLVLSVDRVTRLQARLGTREVEMRLPDRSVARGKQLSMSVLRRSRDAPWARSGIEERLFVSNWGKNDLSIDPGAALGVRGLESYRLAPNRRSRIFMVVREDAAEQERGVALSQAMPGGGAPVRASVRAEMEKVGESLAVRSRAGDAEVEWGGFRCRLPNGRRILIDPLSGRPFGMGRSVSGGTLPTERTPSPGKEAGERK